MPLPALIRLLDLLSTRGQEVYCPRVDLLSSSKFLEDRRFLAWNGFSETIYVYEFFKSPMILYLFLSSTYHKTNHQTLSGHSSKQTKHKFGH